MFLLLSVHDIVTSIQKEVTELLNDHKDNQKIHIDNIKILCNAYGVVLGNED